MRRFLILLLLGAGLALASPTISSVEACPMCKTANESADDPRPRAYMYSILFMLAMPATIFTGFGVGFYRMSKKSSADRQEALREMGIEV